MTNTYKKSQVFNIKISESELRNLKALSILKNKPASRVIIELAENELLRIVNENDNNKLRYELAESSFSEDWNDSRNDIWDAA